MGSDGDDLGGTAQATVAPVAAAGTEYRRPAPYPGPHAFAEDDAPFFFGRAPEAATLLATLGSSRLTVLYGPSGAGKTSLLFAGVVRRLREEQDESALCVLRFPVDEPRRSFERAAQAALQNLAGDEPLPSAAGTLVDTLHAWTERAGTLLVVLDQFEDYLRHHEDRADGKLAGFSAEVERIVRDRELAVHVLLSVHEECVAELGRFEGHIPPGLVEYVRLDHLRPEAAREAIQGPVFAWDRTLPAGTTPYFVEGGLVEELLAFAPAADTDGIEPTILQIVLERLWRDAIANGAHALTLARFDALGPERIVEEHVLSALGRLNSRERDVATACFRFLVTGATERLAQRADDLAEWIRRPESQVAALLDKLCRDQGGRLVRAVAADGDVTRYELFHDLFASPVAAWRNRHDTERKTETRQRLKRIGVAAGVLVAACAVATVWAIDARNTANSRYQAQRTTDRRLHAQILQLTAAQRAARREAAARNLLIRRLTRANAAATAQTAELEAARSGLDAQIANLRAENHQSVVAIKRFNAWNATLATNINALDKTYDGLATQLTDLQAQKAELQGASATLAAQAAAATTELATLTAQNQDLSRRAAELGFATSQPSTPSTTAAPKTAQQKPVSASTFPIASDVSGADPLRHHVAVLEHQLVTLAQQARPADHVQQLRAENALLAQQRDSLVQENEQLGATRAALDSRNHALQETRTEASTEHKRLMQESAANTGRNAARMKQIAALQQGNTTLQNKAAKQVAALGATERAIAAARVENTTLIAFLEPVVAKLTHAALAATDPQLAGLLALEAFRFTPYDADDPAHPGVYNSLWLSLKQLDQSQASKLIAPGPRPAGKVGTTQSAVLAKTLCTHIDRGLTPDEWASYLPAGAGYGAAANPCS